MSCTTAKARGVGTSALPRFTAYSRSMMVPMMLA